MRLSVLCDWPASADLARTRALARNLVELLSSYEEELMLLERGVPGVAPLRRVVGAAIAEACYLIADEPAEEWPSSLGQPRAPRPQ